MIRKDCLILLPLLMPLLISTAVHLYKKLTSVTQYLITNCKTTGTGGMEVDQDVAGWLDSLLPNQSPQGTKTHNIGAGHDSGIGEMNGNQESPMRSSSSANMMLDSGRNTVNNNLLQGNTNTMIGSQTDSFLDDSDMIMATLHSPVSVQHKF